MSGIDSVPGMFSTYSLYTRPLTGRLQVPVVASQSLYAQFQYVQGIPSEHGGLSVDRLQIIDSLLSQINSRSNGAEPMTRQDVNLQQPEHAIDQLSNQVHALQKQAGPFQVWSGVEGQIVNVRV